MSTVNNEIFLVANWKMNGSMSYVDSLVKNFSCNNDISVIICPPFPYLSSFGYLQSMLRVANLISEDQQLLLSHSVTELPSHSVTEKIIRDNQQRLSLLNKSQFNNKHFLLGAQNCHFKDSGPYTGEVSPSMLKELGCSYTILGHSERRSLFNEDNEIIKKKAFNAISCGLKVILCVGEKSENQLSDELLNQCNDVMPENATDDNVIIAYEPIYAIGRGRPAELSVIEQSVSLIRGQVGVGKKIMYGGSVNENNVAEIMKCQNISGVLVGNASLAISSFTNIMNNML